MYAFIINSVVDRGTTLRLQLGGHQYTILGLLAIGKGINAVPLARQKTPTFGSTNNIHLGCHERHSKPIAVNSLRCRRIRQALIGTIRPIPSRCQRAMWNVVCASLSQGDVLFQIHGWSCRNMELFIEAFESTPFTNSVQTGRMSSFGLLRPQGAT